MVSARPTFDRLLGSVRRSGLAFAAGFSMMTIELMAGRLTAPALGSSLYTWTATIASVMAGVALGAWAGGTIADKKRNGPLIGPILLVAAVSVLGTLIVAQALGPILSAANAPIQLLTITFALAVFLPPSVALGAVTPALLTRRLMSTTQTGEVYGSLGAWNAAGSILGVYFTGFFLIGYVGTRTAYLATAAILALLGLITWIREVRRSTPVV